MRLVNPLNHHGSVYINSLKNEPNTYYGVVKEKNNNLLKKFVNDKPEPITMDGPQLFLHRIRNFDDTINVSNKGHSDEHLKVTFKGNSRKLNLRA